MIYFWKRPQPVPLFVVTEAMKNEDKKIFKEEELTEIVEFLDLNDNREEYQNK